MSLYEEMRGVAREILGDPDFKQGVMQYVKVTPGSGPVDEPGAPTETSYDMDGVARGVSARYVQEGLAQASDLQATMSARDDLTPELTGFVRMDGKRFKIVQVLNIPPVGVIVAHRLIFRNSQ